MEYTIDIYTTRGITFDDAERIAQYADIGGWGHLTGNLETTITDRGVRHDFGNVWCDKNHHPHDYLKGWLRAVKEVVGGLDDVTAIHTYDGLSSRHCDNDGNDPYVFGALD